VINKLLHITPFQSLSAKLDLWYNSITLSVSANNFVGKVKFKKGVIRGMTRRQAEFWKLKEDIDAKVAQFREELAKSNLSDKDKDRLALNFRIDAWSNVDDDQIKVINSETRAQMNARRDEIVEALKELKSTHALNNDAKLDQEGKEEDLDD
jgi:hypothetical protein